ncbi:MAG TPA: phosphatase PAP2 family protein [Thermoanaerobaculia bacterium]
MRTPTGLTAGIVAGFLAIASIAPAQTPADPPAGSSKSADASSSLPAVLGREGSRYLSDTIGILGSPLHWNGGEWSRAAIFIAAIGAVALEDQRIDTALERHRTSRAEAVSDVVTPFGSYAGLAISAASLGGGLIFHNDAARDTGRDALEAVFLAGGIVTPVIKTIVGRTRPRQGGDGDEFHAFSNAQSFPSGHTAEAFAVASVFAARSKGWIVPTIAYGLAAGVALARVNDRAHFPSDVLAGAIIGTTIGRSIVHRHRGTDHEADWDVVPVPARKGGGLAIRFSIGPARHGDS